MIQEQAPIISNTEVMPGTHLMWVRTGMASSARPGQFAMLGCDDGNLRLLRRPVSIHAVKSGMAAFLFAVVGAGTEWLAQRQPGKSLDLTGPFGKGFSIEAKSHKLLLIAGGMGIAPFTFLAEDGLNKGLNVRILAGARTATQICPTSLIPASCEFITATEDGTAGEKGLVTALLPRHVDWADQIFICGPLPMFKAIASNCEPVLKGKSVQVSLEVRMGCGMGFCYACTIRTKLGLKQVCKDGPVFPLNDVIWDELK
ncbi:MAG TPA: dihydroorotate dehydrogenase electron transfer subunit [Dehalococcoidales bacterium]